MNKLLTAIGAAMLALSVGSVAIGLAATGSTASVTGEVHVVSVATQAWPSKALSAATPVDGRFVFQHVVDGNANGSKNERDANCDGDGGSVMYAGTQYDVICAHLVLNGDVNDGFGMLVQEDDGSYAAIRGLSQQGPSMKVQSVEVLTGIHDLVCGKQFVNMGPDTSGAACQAKWDKTILHYTLDQSGGTIHTP